MDANTERIQRALRADDGIELREPARIEEVEAFEARYGIALPPAYRAFLIGVANGFDVDGSPALFTLEEVGAELETAEVDAAAPFSYSKADAAALRKAVAAVAVGRGVLGDARVMSLQKQGSPNGCLTIAASEGNDFVALVVTGEQTGVVWRTGEIDLPAACDHYGANGDPDAPLDFPTWLELWCADLFGVSFDDSQPDDDDGD